MRTALIIALPLLAIATPLAAQEHDHSAHATPPAEAPAPQEPAHDHSQMDHSQMDHSQHGQPAAAGTTLPSAPPARAAEGPAHAADPIWGAAAMATAREGMVREMGGQMAVGVVRLDRLEARFSGEEGYLWDAEAMFGNDIDKLVIKSEGEGDFGGALEEAEVQALWGHAFTPWFDLQAGLRVDVEPRTRTYLALGVEGLAPYNIHLDAAAFLSDEGDLSATIEAEHDMRLTQRLILQPRVEAEFAAQTNVRDGIGSGLSSIGAGLRLRYEIAREFAPYVGVEWEQQLGRTRRLSRLGGEDPSATAVVLGVRAWF